MNNEQPVSFGELRDYLEQRLRAVMERGQHAAGAQRVQLRREYAVLWTLREMITAIADANREFVYWANVSQQEQQQQPGDSTQ